MLGCAQRVALEITILYRKTTLWSGSYIPAVRGNATGTPGPVDQVEGSLICDAGQKDQTIFTTTPVPLNAQGNADFSGTFNTTPGTCTNPLFLIRFGPDLPAANQRWIATGAVRSFGDSNGHN